VSILRALIWVATAVCVFMLFRPLVEQLLLQLSTDAGFP
jgi:hypothetical protein